MTLRKFFVGRAIGFGLVLIIGLGIVGYKTYFSTPKHAKIPQPLTQENGVNTTPPIFKWKYEQATTLNLDGLPKTNLFLEVTYDTGKIERKLIDTPDGSCNELPDSKEPRVSNSSVTQCYAAGFGAYYKVIKVETSYQVMRKEFEEGSPEYNPPEQKFEVIAEFPFVIK